MTTRLYKKLAIAALLGVIIWAYDIHIAYVSYLFGIYPVKAEVKDVSIEFDGAWLPLPNEFIVGEGNSKISLPTRVFFKIDGLRPSTQGTMGISWIGDKYDGFSRTNTIYSNTMHFDWGTANILKKEFTANPGLVFAAVPEFKILINAENLDQLKEIRKFTKITVAGSSAK